MDCKFVEGLAPPGAPINSVRNHRRAGRKFKPCFFRGIHHSVVDLGQVAIGPKEKLNFFAIIRIIGMRSKVSREFSPVASQETQSISYYSMLNVEISGF